MTHSLGRISEWINAIDLRVLLPAPPYHEKWRKWIRIVEDGQKMSGRMDRFR